MTIRRARRNEKGGTLIEFTLVGIPLILILISLIEICIAMWSYHTLAYAVREGAHYAATKGKGCYLGSNSCNVTVANIAQQIATAGTGLIPAQLNVTLSCAGCTAVSCTPITNCYSNTTAWPPNSSPSNVPGSIISVSGTYPVQTNLVIMFFPKTGGSQMGAVTLPASSQQVIQF